MTWEHWDTAIVLGFLAVVFGFWPDMFLAVFCAVAAIALVVAVVIAIKG
jgi:hypothetical protein